MTTDEPHPNAAVYAAEVPWRTRTDTAGTLRGNSSSSNSSSGRQHEKVVLKCQAMKLEGW